MDALLPAAVYQSSLPELLPPYQSQVLNIRTVQVSPARLCALFDSTSTDNFHAESLLHLRAYISTRDF
jgi:hypothetical protein